MTRITSVLTIAAGAVLGLAMAATSADAGGRHHVRDNCETRIFQGEDEACYEVNRDFLVLFGRDDGPILEELAPPPPQAEGFKLLTSEGGRFDCGCQLRRKNDLICAGGDDAVIGSVDRRGRRASGELFIDGEQTRFTAKRLDLEVCQQTKEE